MSAIEITSSVRAIHDFEGQNEEELTFKMGDVFNVTEIDLENGWLTCEASDGRSGLVPIAYVVAVEAVVPEPEAVITTPPIAGAQISQTGTIDRNQPVVEADDVITKEPKVSKKPYFKEPGEAEWNYGIFSCTEECGMCCRGCFCPLDMLKEISEDLNDKMFNPKYRSITFPCVFCGTLFFRREQQRKQYEIDGHWCLDFMVSFWCISCSLTQMKRQMLLQKEKRNKQNEEIKPLTSD